MLLIKTYINKSTIPNAGMGCFAAEDVKQGDLIWELDTLFDNVYTAETVNSMNELYKEYINTYAFKTNGLYFLCNDNARFFNHSEDPNTYDPLNEFKTYALKDIKKGDEILSDYKTFGSSEDLEFNSVL